MFGVNYYYSNVLVSAHASRLYNIDERFNHELDRVIVVMLFPTASMKLNCKLFG